MDFKVSRLTNQPSLISRAMFHSSTKPYTIKGNVSETKLPQFRGQSSLTKLHFEGISLTNQLFEGKVSLTNLYFKMSPNNLHFKGISLIKRHFWVWQSQASLRGQSFTNQAPFRSVRAVTKSSFLDATNQDV